MSFDFNPEIEISDNKKDTKKEREAAKVEARVAQAEAVLVSQNSNNSDVVTMNNLLGITRSHIYDDNKCREVVENLTEELNNSIQIMSIKEMLEYLKVKLKEREFHVDCIFKAYAFIQRSECAREMFLGSNRKERIIEATDRKRINGLLSMLNSTGD